MMAPVVAADHEGEQTDTDKSDSGEILSENMPEDLRMKNVITSLLQTTITTDEDVRKSAANSLSLVGHLRPLLLLTEWHGALSGEKEKSKHLVPVKKKSIDPSDSKKAQPTTCLISCLAPVMEYMTQKRSLNAGDVRHRAVLGQIMAALVEEMTKDHKELRGNSVQSICQEILVNLAGCYMDKVMDVLLVHFQPHSGSTIHPAVVNTLASLAASHPHGSVPFSKAILSTTAHLLKEVRSNEADLRFSFTGAITKFSEAILDYLANIDEMPDSTVTVEHYNMDANIIYETLFMTWLPQGKDNSIKAKILEAMAAMTPFLSNALVLEKGSQFINSLVSLYKKFGSSSCPNLEITLCLSQLLDVISSSDSVFLDSILDPILNVIFQQACISPDYSVPKTVKNHYEILRCYDIIMKVFPEKLVHVLLTKLDSSEEKTKIGALVVLKHLLNLSTEILGERLMDIFEKLSLKLNENNRAVQKVIAQIIVLLGHHGCLTGNKGRTFLEFIVQLCAVKEDDGTKFGLENVQKETLSEMSSNILQLLTTSIPSVEPVLWPHLLEYIMQQDSTLAIPAITRSLAFIAKKKQETNSADYSIDYGDFQHTPTPNCLLVRLLVLASVPLEGGRGIHILKFLQRFSTNINRHLVDLWDARIPLLTHYLEQNESVDSEQWQSWLFTLLHDSLEQIGMEEWNCQMVTAFVDQFQFYENHSKEKSFAIRCVAHVLTLVANRQVVQDHLDFLFNECIEGNIDEKDCSIAFGLTASRHLELVLNKLESLYNNQIQKKTNLFAFLKDKFNEEKKQRNVSLIIQCIGKAAENAPFKELEMCADGITKKFLSPCLFNYKDCSQILEAVLKSISVLAEALKALMAENPEFSLAHQEELLHSTISILQDSTIPIGLKQLALDALTNLIQLPPNISQLTRCSLLKACFTTIFAKVSDISQSEAKNAESDNQLKPMVDKLNILIQELLRQDMEQSTVDEIFTMLEPLLKLDQELSRKVATGILLETLSTFSKNVRIGINSANNFAPGPYMIGAMVPRCHDPSEEIRKASLQCFQFLIKISSLFEGISEDIIDNAMTGIKKIGSEVETDMDVVSKSLSQVLIERIQHHNLLALMDSLAELVLDSKECSVRGTIRVFNDIVVKRGQELFQNIPAIVTKLHEKMLNMQVDDSSDLQQIVAEAIHQMAIHSVRGVITSLLHMDFPVDSSARIIWICLANDNDLSANVLNILLEAISMENLKESSDKKDSAPGSSLRVAAAMDVMFETRKLEDICREEFSRIFSSLMMLLSKGIGKDSSSDYLVTLDAIRNLFSSVNCVVVASSIPKDIDLTDLSQLCNILTRLISSISQHAPSHLHAIVGGLSPFSTGEAPECMRVASSAVLAAIVAEKAGSDSSLIASIIQTLLMCTSDTSVQVKQLALEGIQGLHGCTEEDIDKNATIVLAALIHGIEDAQSPEVTLIALRGLNKLLMKVSSIHVYLITASVALKVRPFIESSSDEHRAAAITIYAALAKFAEGDHRSTYLDYAQSILVPVLLHSTSEHEPTKQACLEALNALAKVIDNHHLLTYLRSVSSQIIFEKLVENIIKARSDILIDMYATTVGNGISYYKSQNPMLRKNITTLLSNILCFTQDSENNKVDEALVNSVITCMVELLTDPDSDVRKTSAKDLGMVMVCTSKP